MNAIVQWAAVAALVVAAVVYIVRRLLKARNNPCAGCGLAESCNKSKKNDCKNNKRA